MSEFVLPILDVVGLLPLLPDPRDDGLYLPPVVDVELTLLPEGLSLPPDTAVSSLCTESKKEHTKCTFMYIYYRFYMII